MALSKKVKFSLAASASVAALALSGLFDQEASADFWTANKYVPLKQPESVAYRTELTERFAKNNYHGQPTVGDLCAAHSLALLEEKIKENAPSVEALSTEESLLLTMEITMRCSQGIKPEIN